MALRSRDERDRAPAPAGRPSAFTRTLSGLAYVEDVTGAETEVQPKHLHGGVCTLAYSLESAIRVAAARGLVGRARLTT